MYTEILVKRNLFIFNFKKRYPSAFILVLITIAGGIFYVLRLPPETKRQLISQVQEGRTSFFIKERIQQLKNEDFSNYIFILGDSTTMHFEKELSEEKTLNLFLNIKDDIKFISFTRRALTPVDYFFIVNKIAPLKPKAIIACINLATFSPVYQDNQTYKFPDMISLCDPILLESNIDVLKRFYGLNSEAVRKFAKTRAENEYNLTFVGLKITIRNWIKKNIEGRILGRWTNEEMIDSKKYASTFLHLYRIDRNFLPDDHPYFILSKRMYELCTKSSTELIFYIAPFDVEFAKKAKIYNDIKQSVDYIKNQFYNINKNRVSKVSVL